MSLPRRVHIVGGGISGLTTAYRLAAAGVDVTVHEAADRPGGKLGMTQVGDLRLETGADSFVARKPWAVDLCRELGLAGELVTPGAKGAYLWTDRGLVSFPKDAPFGIPGDIGDVFRWPGVSRAGRRRAAMDLLRGKRKDGAEETLGGLLRRRLGDEATEMAVAPLLAGLYAGDVDTLSARATFPELLMWESSQGSLIRGSQAAMRSVRRGTPTPMFVKPKGGVGRLTDALAASLGDRVETGAPVGSLSDLGERGDASAVVLAVPSFEAGRLLGSTAPAASVDLAAIPYASTGVVFLVYGDGTQEALPEGTGFVVPRGKAPMTASTWISSKWPEPAFGSRAVVRCYVGGVGDEDVLERGGSGPRRRVRTASVRRARSPDPAAGIVGRPVDARDAAIRSGARGARRADPRDPSPRHLRRRLCLRRSGCSRLRQGGGRDGRTGTGAPRSHDDRKGDGSMSDTTTNDTTASIYALYPAFRARDGFRDLSADALADVVQEVENLYKTFDGRVDVRGTYSTVGFRPDTDLMLWLVGSEAEDVQAFLSEFRRTQAGRLTDLAWTFMGMVQPAEFSPSHQPAFVKGVPPKTFLCVYPFVRTPEWYLLPREERGALLAEHGGAGREFPDILANTTSAFGLGDWEWILAFEADRLASIVDCIRRLRETKARLYTKVEVPFVTGIRKTVADAFADLA